ncbi:MAG: COX15/CtaA family protein [Beijerinckiaceae bacterium]
MGTVFAEIDAYHAVRIWLWIAAGFVVAMIVIGGATRLTGSGLSITEWRPLTGALPPLSDVAWQVEFDRYRAIPQYELLNKGMSLSAFKFIYWWEWGHRQLGRVLGLVYMLPLIWFIVRGTIRGRLMVWLLALGALGGFQGAIGWLMVASGLQAGMIAVAPIKLALHLTMACIILTCLVWTARALRPAGVVDRLVPPRLSFTAKALVVLILVQIALGALVAGSKSGLTYNTWPLMDGVFIPTFPSLFAATPWIANFVENSTLVQFNHRMTAYVLLALAVWHALDARRNGGTAGRGAAHIAGGMLLQAATGIVTLLLVVPLWAGLAHQLLAALILIAAVIHAERLARVQV